MNLDNSDILAILVIVFFVAYGFINLVLGWAPRETGGTTFGDLLLGVPV